MKSWQKLAIAAGVFSLAACESELPRRYKAMTMERQASGAPLVRASAFVIEKPESGEEPGVLQLDAEGQASLITAVSAMENTAKGLYQQLAKGFARQPMREVIDRSKITRRIVFSTQKAGLAAEPADRISRLEFNLEGLPDGLQFHQWNRFETEYGEVDLGKIGLKKGAELSAKLSPTFGGGLNAGEAGITVSRELSEEINLRQRFIGLTGTLDAQRATLVQEGVTGIDLSGNTSIDLTVAFDRDALDPERVVRFDSFRTNKGLKTADEVSYRVIPLHVPSYTLVCEKLAQGIRTRLAGSYVLRHVRKGSATIMEGDDVVVFARGDLDITPREMLFMSHEQLNQLRARFFIHSLRSEGENLAIDHSRQDPNLPLDFATYEEAEEFIDWIGRQNAVTVGGRQLKLNQKPLAQGDIANLRVGIHDCK
jgi:hypothetical protein